MGGCLSVWSNGAISENNSSVLSSRKNHSVQGNLSCPHSRDVTSAFYQSLSLAQPQLLRLLKWEFTHIQHRSCKADFLGLHACCILSLPCCLGNAAYMVIKYEKLLCCSEWLCNSIQISEAVLSI